LGGGTMMKRHYDYLIVGAGFAGSVLAERLASVADKRVLVIDRRSHIGGNAFDMYDEAGILVHLYGPHIFHTNSGAVFNYLSQFTEWRPYEHRVLANVEGQLVPMPINRRTVSLLAGREMSSEEVEAYLASMAEPREPCRTAEDVVVGQVGRKLYEQLYQSYTRKQWGLDPSKLDARITRRLPIRTDDDDRYFTDTYQAMPLDGYTKMFERMLAHANIDIALDTDYRALPSDITYDQLVYTGPIDEYFDHCYGSLPYRSLTFKHVTLDEQQHQPVAVVNYPGAEYEYTRVTEFKQVTGQEHEKTSLAYEYPSSVGDPYYPVLHDDSRDMMQRYRELAAKTPDVHFTGRLATFQYYNMDQVVAQSLALFARLSGERWTSGVAVSTGT
jgi:UDP-galactopyranose mutase